MNKSTVLVIDDEAQIRKLLTITLEAQEFTVNEATTAKEGLAAVANHPPDLILLDIGLPDQNGHDVLKHLREWYTNPVIILSVQSNEEDIVRALDNGASDYLVKPFRTGELMARIRAALRKNTADENHAVLSFGDVVLDFSSRTVKKNNQKIKLTATEYTLLALLAKNESKVLTHHYLLTQVWGPSYREESQYLRVFIAQLRKKIEADPNRPVHIITESGVGYRFIA
ncbi:MAG: response regulator [Bacteroidetes bacterium]|nr:response regulator [Bacteroidota bacterium]